MQFLTSYLTNVRQYIVVNGVKSGCDLVKCDVLQRSVIDPVLLALYVNDIKRAIWCDDTKFFAGDIFLIRTHTHWLCI